MTGMHKIHLLRALILPGLVFQSVVIAGGYATGRELVEFFLSYGPRSGAMGLALVALIWGVVLALSFEFARSFKSYNYKDFFQNLLGRWWFLYELAYLATLLLILSVIGAAAGVMVGQALAVSPMVGTIGLIACIGLLTFYGSQLIEKVLAGWSLVLYLAYAIFLVSGFLSFGDQIAQGFSGQEESSAWLMGGIKYASYNLAIVPTILFCVRHLNTRGEAICSGFLAGILAIIPGVLFYCVMVGFYPAILAEEVPMTAILAALDQPLLTLLLHVVILGTFVETGTALLHAVNERMAVSFQGRDRVMNPYLRPLFSVAIMVLAIFVGDYFGLINLIASGYGMLTYIFLAIFIVPLLTVGLAKLMAMPSLTSASSNSPTTDPEASRRY
jgi:uncharacterized membrane protein YkvI